MEVPVSRTCPVATVVIPDGRESDFSDRKLRSKSLSRQSASGVGSDKEASKSAGRSECEPIAPKSFSPSLADYGGGVENAESVSCR